MNWIKMYDGVGSALRVEKVINDHEMFKSRPQVARAQRQVTQWLLMSRAANTFSIRMCR
jgi:hypothetical protein